MADLTLKVREKSRPTVIFAGLNAWRDRNGDIEDITGWVLKLIIKRFIDDPDSEALFDATATVTSGPDGEYGWVFTLAHTAFEPGTYAGEVRVWTSGATTNPPHDARTLDYVIEEAVKISE